MAKQKPAIDWIVYVAVRCASTMFQVFPIDLNLRTARFLGRIWYHIMPRHRERAREHLRLAYGDTLTDHQVNDYALRSMQQITMMVVELMFTPRLVNEWTWPRYIRLKGIEQALDVLVTRRGAILVTGHYGSWELVGFMLATLGFPLTAVMRPLDNPYLNDYLMTARARRGLRLLYKKGATQNAADILVSGGVLGFIADQNAGRKGLFVDFFGVKASTYKSIALLAMEHNVPIVVGCARRVSDRFRYEVECTRVIRPQEWTGRDDPLLWITQQYSWAIEQFVRQAPEQYLWMHRRWKSRPKDEDAAAELPA
ncbi:MAG TPA: lysophospholipid acyltransferase family protein [Phycisphaerae bacterium]|nr:lysophospholipid acyltransferase family protein [Phycisphaerae bacterium]HRY67139.1 lysophospholipid acyltransferase family protein [Phycisphaerae bacterium]HSA26492.1 lysophospholipid acyltransferase family protein [Phycisphaerae bacterium]